MRGVGGDVAIGPGGHLLAVAALPVLVEGRHVEAVLSVLPEVSQVILKLGALNVNLVLQRKLVLKREKI